MLLSVVLPALNEERAVGATVRSVPVSELAGDDWETESLVVDNGSTDGTVREAIEAGASVIHESRRGYGYAIRAGYEEAAGDIVVTADADCTYPLHALPHMLGLMRAYG